MGSENLFDGRFEGLPWKIKYVFFKATPPGRGVAFFNYANRTKALEEFR